MRNSVELLSERLYSLPVPIRFFGAEGTTISFARAGWGLSMRQQLSYRHGNPELQLAMENEKAGLYALSHPISLEYSFMRSINSTEEYFNFFKTIGFEIMYCAPKIRFQVMPVMGRSFVDSFEAFDPYPSARENVEVCMSEFKFFKPYAPNIKDIVVEPGQVAELMDLVLKAQAPTIEQIKKREQTRRNLEAMREMELEGKSREAHKVQMQLITLTG